MGKSPNIRKNAFLSEEGGEEENVGEDEHFFRACREGIVGKELEGEQQQERDALSSQSLPPSRISEAEKCRSRSKMEENSYDGKEAITLRFKAFFGNQTGIKLIE